MSKLTAEDRLGPREWIVIAVLAAIFATIIVLGAGCGSGERREIGGTVTAGDNANIVAPVEGSDATAKADRIESVVQHKFGLDANMLALLNKAAARGAVMGWCGLAILLGAATILAFSEPLSKTHLTRLIARCAGAGVVLVALFLAYNAIKNGG